MPVDTLPQFHESPHILAVLRVYQTVPISRDDSRRICFDALRKPSYANGNREGGAIGYRRGIMRTKPEEFDSLNDCKYGRKILG
jgi:hypothetical protein